MDNSPIRHGTTGNTVDYGYIDHGLPSGMGIQVGDSEMRLAAITIEGKPDLGYMYFQHLQK